MSAGEHPILAELAQAYASLPARGSALRGLIVHYPRPDLPGKCAAIVTTFHDLPDFTIAEDLEEFGRYTNELAAGHPKPGMLFEVRQVWQMEGAEPRLIEATIELSDNLRTLAPRRLAPDFFRDSMVQKISVDAMRGGHFEYAGGGDRRCVTWCDRSAGIGPAKPWSAAYRVRPKREFSKPLNPAIVTALKEFVSRF